MMEGPIRVLIVEDSEDDEAMLLRQLRRGGLDVEHLRVETARAMREALARQPWDVIISDYSMPEFSAGAALSVLRETGLDIPFIIVSGTIGEETAVEALKSGAGDFMTKGRLSRLLPAIEREMRDAAERRKLRTAEATLAEIRERMQFALEAAGVGTWESDAVTGQTTWSDVLQRLHGISPGEFGGTFDAFIESMHPEDQQRVRDEIVRAVRDRTDTRLAYRVTWPDGSIRWIAGIGHTFYGDDGQPVRAAGIGIDVTAQRELEEQFRQAQKMESIGNLAGGVAHDFNNLLTAIAGYAEMLAERHAADAASMEEVNEIRRAASSAADLTRQLLAFGRKQLLAPRLVGLNDIVSGLQKMVRRLIEENVQIDFSLDGNLPPTNVDPGQIEQVVLNLAVNARDAMPDGGVLTIETAEVVLDETYAREHSDVRPGSYVVLSVSDTGPGIPPHVREHLFEPFFTTKPRGQGTGLGLATVFGIVKQSGGHIWVYSEAGVGTTFKIYFPAASGQVLQPALAQTVSETLTGTETVLVVEDDRALRVLEERSLRRYGYTVLVASDAVEARQIFAGHPGVIDVVLTDVIMPGDSGRAIGEWVRAQHPGTKVIYMSGYTDNAIAHYGVLESGMHFLQKPFTPDSLARKIREVLS